MFLGVTSRGWWCIIVGMRKVPDFVADLPEYEGVLVRELRFPEWWEADSVTAEDPFAGRARIKLSGGAQHQLLRIRKVLQAAKLEFSERQLNDSDRLKFDEISRAYEWVQETLLESLSLLIFSRVVFAKKRRGVFSGSMVDDLVPEAYACAIGCMDVWAGEGLFSSYVGASVDAALSKNVEGNPGGGAMPESWQIALKHVPSLEQELIQRLGRRGSDVEMREAYLERARMFDRARIMERGGETDPVVLDELVHQRMKKRGTYAAAENIAAIRALAGGVQSLSVDAFDLEGEPDVACELTEGVSGVSDLLSHIPGVVVGEPMSSSVRSTVRECLSSNLLAALVEFPLPVEEVKVSRKVPSAFPV